MELIDNRPILAAVEEAVARGTDWSVIANRAGFKSRNKADTRRLKRVLGAAPEITSFNKRYVSGRRYYNKRISYKNALRIVQAIDKDPVDFGL